MLDQLSQEERNQLQAVLKRDKLLRDVDRRRVIATNAHRKVFRNVIQPQPNGPRKLTSQSQTSLSQASD